MVPWDLVGRGEIECKVPAMRFDRSAANYLVRAVANRWTCSFDVVRSGREPQYSVLKVESVVCVPGKVWRLSAAVFPHTPYHSLVSFNPSS